MERFEPVAASRIGVPRRRVSLDMMYEARRPTPFHTRPAGRSRVLSRLVKRVLDVALSALGLVCFLPLLVLLAGAIRLHSPGPVLFRQRRLGRGRRPFDILKLRTMRADAEHVLRHDPFLRSEHAGNGYKLPSGADPRVTWLGEFLRHTSMDELPQLVNVLRGEMSLVGPRPVVPQEIHQYGQQADLVLSVRPGITGLWQVSGRDEIGYPRRAELDAEYVRRWSVLADVRILLRTPAAVLRGEGGGNGAAPPRARPGDR